MHVHRATECAWPHTTAHALQHCLSSCGFTGLCDTLDGIGGGYTKAQILTIMRDSRNGSYATICGGLWVVAKAASLARLGELAGPSGSTWALGASVGAGPAIIVGQCVARASA